MGTLPRSRLGPLQHQLLRVLVSLGNDAYGVPIWQKLEEATESSVGIGAVYTTLERLERKGLVSSRVGEPTAERGGRAKRYYAITGEGVRALHESEQAFANLNALLPHLETEL